MKTFRSARSMIAVLTLIGSTAACDDAAGLGEHANINRVLLTISGEPVTIHLAGATGSFTLDAGTHTVTAAAYDPDGDRLPLDDEYALVIGSSNQGVARFTSVSNMSGTLVTATGTTTLQVRIDHDHGAEFGPHSVPINVH